MPTLSTSPSIGVPASATRRAQSSRTATSATTTDAVAAGARDQRRGVAGRAGVAVDAHDRGALGGGADGDRPAVAHRRVGLVTRLRAGADDDDPAAGEAGDGTPSPPDRYRSGSGERRPDDEALRGAADRVAGEEREGVTRASAR